ELKSQKECKLVPGRCYLDPLIAYLNLLFTKDELFPGGFIRSSRINLQPWSRRRETLTPRYQERDARSAHFLRLGYVPSERLDEIIGQLLLELVPPPPPFAAVLVPDVPDLPLLHRVRDLPEPPPSMSGSSSLTRDPSRRGLVARPPRVPAAQERTEPQPVLDAQDQLDVPRGALGRVPSRTGQGEDQRLPPVFAGGPEEAVALPPRVGRVRPRADAVPEARTETLGPVEDPLDRPHVALRTAERHEEAAEGRVPLVLPPPVPAPFSAGPVELADRTQEASSRLDEEPDPPRGIPRARAEHLVDGRADGVPRDLRGEGLPDPTVAHGPEEAGVDVERPIPLALACGLLIPHNSDFQHFSSTDHNETAVGARGRDKASQFL
ncbi:hypothetical protein THAOC_36922, partial [Thalassiosira oceanica]